MPTWLSAIAELAYLTASAARLSLDLTTGDVSLEQLQQRASGLAAMAAGLHELTLRFVDSNLTLERERAEAEATLPFEWE